MKYEYARKLSPSKIIAFLGAGLLAAAATALGQPTLTAISPTPNARAAARTSPVVVGFSQALSAGSAGALKVFSAQRGGLRTRGGTPATVNGPTLQFTPSAYPFAPGETVSSTVTTAAASTGGALASARVAQFTAAVGGTGTGNFLAPAVNPNPAVGPGPVNVVLGDLDGDGDLDFVTANVGTSTTHNYTVSIRFNDGTGNFQPGYEAFAGDEPAGLALGDVDGDGAIDLVVANYYGNSVGILHNNGRGYLTLMATLPNVGYPLSLALGDVDGDGDLDVVTANYFLNSTVSVYLNDGAGTFTLSAGTQALPVGPGPRSLALGDLDGDGDLDIAVANDGLTGNNVLTLNRTVSICLNDGVGRFTIPAGFGTVQTQNTPKAIALGDVDGDGDLDFVTANYGNNVNIYNIGTTASVRLNDGTGRFTAAATNPDVAVDRLPTSVALGDVDADGDLDLVVGSAGGTVNVCLNNGLGNFTPPVLSAAPRAGRLVSHVALGDVDGDGDLDLLACDIGTAINTASYAVNVRLNYSPQGIPLTVRVSGDSLLCNGGQVQLSAIATAGVLSYRWSTGAATAAIVATQPGTYAVTATFSGGQTRSAQRQVLANAPAVQLSGDSLLCAGTTLQLLGSAPGATSYQWNTGAGTAALVVSQPGTYTFTAQYGSGCTVSRRTTVRVRPGLVPFTLGADTTLCEGAALLLQPPAYGNGTGVTYRWSTGDTSPTLRVQETGTYRLQLATACDVQTASRRVQFIQCLTFPNIITPNGDQRNERFVVEGLTGGDWMLQVYSRWGQRVFSTPAYHNDWGETATAGVYYYILQRPGDTVAFRGWLEVVR